MKKFISVFLSILMAFSVLSVAAFAADSYTVTFAECPYDVSSFRTDYVGKYMGYEFGTDYWFTITNEDTTTTQIKGERSITVPAGKSIEITVSVADKIEPSSVRMLTFPTGSTVTELYDSLTGEPFSQYYISRSTGGTYGIRPTQDMTVCISEFHLYNDAFLYTLPSSNYYTAARVQYNAGNTNPWDTYSDFEWGNTKVIYVGETMFFNVSIPLDDPAHTYHYDNYQVYYTLGTGSAMKTVYLKQKESSDGAGDAIDEKVAHYETDTDWVDVYKIENVDSTLKVKVTGTVTYTFSMLGEFFDDFDIENIDQIDFDALDLSPIVEYVMRVVGLIIKILNGFGLNINIADVFG